MSNSKNASYRASSLKKNRISIRILVHHAAKRPQHIDGGWWIRQAALQGAASLFLIATDDFHSECPGCGSRDSAFERHHGAWFQRPRLADLQIVDQAIHQRPEGG